MRQTTRDGVVAFKLLASNAKRNRPRCSYFKLAPGSEAFKQAVAKLAQQAEFSAEFLELMLTAMIEGDEETLYAQSRSLCEEASLRLVDVHLLYHHRTPIAQLPQALGNEASLTGVSKEELARFLVSRLNHLHREVLIFNRRIH